LYRIVQPDLSVKPQYLTTLACCKINNPYSAAPGIHMQQLHPARPGACGPAEINWPLPRPSPTPNTGRSALSVYDRFLLPVFAESTTGWKRGHVTNRQRMIWPVAHYSCRWRRALNNCPAQPAAAARNIDTMFYVVCDLDLGDTVTQSPNVLSTHVDFGGSGRRLATGHYFTRPLLPCSMHQLSAVSPDTFNINCSACKT